MPHLLDNMAWHALCGLHSDLAEVSGNGAARRYPPEVSALCGVDAFDEEAWSGLAEIVGPGGFAWFFRDAPVVEPAGWTALVGEVGTQLVAGDLDPAPQLDLSELGTRDRAEMGELVALTQPGPFGPRTDEMGRYVGLRRDGRLIAMAGERLRCEGWVEVSAVCVHPSAQRQGLGAALTLAVAWDIRRRGDEAMLHVREANDGARALYGRIGFRIRTPIHAQFFRRDE